MTAPLRFLQVCEQPFEDLKGDDFRQRRCRRCDVVVHNFDVLTQRERDEVLRRSDQERTVCVGTSMPVAAAPGCRASPSEDGPQPFSRAIAVREEGVVAPQWWRVLSLPTPAVVEAVGELAGDYGLRDVSHAGAMRWHLHDRDRVLSVVVSVQSRGDRTELGVRVHPMEGMFAMTRFDEWTLSHPIVVVAVLLLGLLMFVVLVGKFPLAGPLVMLVVLPLLAGIRALWSRREAAAQQQRTQELKAWGETWQQRFFTALEARLAPKQLYR